MSTMDKPVKARRRRSIRKLRASTGFHSPPLSSAPYGSAWIDQDLETNMDNLVMSLSQLQSNDEEKDSREPKLQRNCNDPSSPMANSGENFCLDKVDKNTSLMCAEESILQEGASVANSNLHSLKPYESLFQPAEMPLDQNSPREAYHFDSCIANVAQSTPSDFSMCRRLLERDQELSNHKELLRDEEIEHSSIHHTGEFPEYESLDYLELKQTNADLSLNFSPVPEQDETIDYLVRSLHNDFEVSFSPQGERPDTPELSPLIPFHSTGTTRDRTLPESLPYLSPTDEIPTPLSQSEFREATYTLSPTIQESPAARNDSRHVDFFDRNINSSCSALFSNIDDESCIGDKSQSLDNTAVLQGIECDRSEIMNAGNIYDENASGDQSDGTSCFARFVGDMTSELERIGSKKVTFNDIVNKDTTSPLSALNARDSSALEQYDGIFQEDSFQYNTKMYKQKKQSKRRSSRQFTMKEFSAAFDEPVEELGPAANSGRAVAFEELEPVANSMPVPACQGNSSNLQFQGILEAEKENIEFVDHYLSVPSDSNVEFSEKQTNVCVHSDVNSNEKNSGKKKRGRKADSFGKGKIVSNVPKNAVKLPSDDCLVLVARNENLSINADVAFKSDQISHKTMAENGVEPLVSESGSDASLTIVAEDDDQQKENFSSTKGSQARRNRKSWGNVSSRRAAVMKQKKVTCVENEPQVEKCQDDESHLEQIYSKQKYVPIKPHGLETIKEVPNTHSFFGKQKIKRYILFSEDFNPTTAKLRLRRKKARQQLKGCPGHMPMDYGEFLTRLNAIELDLDPPV